LTRIPQSRKRVIRLQKQPVFSALRPAVSLDRRPAADRAVARRPAGAPGLHLSLYLGRDLRPPPATAPTGGDRAAFSF
jgi:hypothetical protein